LTWSPERRASSLSFRCAIRRQHLRRSAEPPKPPCRVSSLAEPRTPPCRPSRLAEPRTPPCWPSRLAEPRTPPCWPSRLAEPPKPPCRVSRLLFHLWSRILAQSVTPGPLESDGAASACSPQDSTLPAGRLSSCSPWPFVSTRVTPDVTAINLILTAPVTLGVASVSMPLPAVVKPGCPGIGSASIDQVTPGVAVTDSVPTAPPILIATSIGIPATPHLKLWLPAAGPRWPIP